MKRHADVLQHRKAEVLEPVRRDWTRAEVFVTFFERLTAVLKTGGVLVRVGGTELWLRPAAGQVVQHGRVLQESGGEGEGPEGGVGRADPATTTS